MVLLRVGSKLNDAPAMAVCATTGVITDTGSVLAGVTDVGGADGSLASPHAATPSKAAQRMKRCVKCRRDVDMAGRVRVQNAIAECECRMRMQKAGARCGINSRS